MSAVTNSRISALHTYSVSAEEMAKRIGIPLRRWPGNCFGIATALVEKGGVKGTAIYGHWLGPVKPGSIFFKRPLIQHGWVLQKDGTVIDPTRFEFEQVEPYIFEGHQKYHMECGDFEAKDPLDIECMHCGHLCTEHGGGFFKPCKLCAWPYDEGGNKLRELNMPPAPDFNAPTFNGKPPKFYEWRPKNKRLATAADILLGPAKRKPGKLSQLQLHWLANLPYDMLTPIPGLDLAPDLYKELKKVGMLAHVPIDNQRRAERKHVKGTTR